MGYGLHGVLHLVETTLGRKDRGAGIIATRLEKLKKILVAVMREIIKDTHTGRLLFDYFHTILIEGALYYSLLTILYKFQRQFYLWENKAICGFECCSLQILLVIAE